MLALLARFTLPGLRLDVGVDVQAGWPNEKSNRIKANVCRVLLIAGAFQEESRTLDDRLIHLAYDWMQKLLYWEERLD